MLESIKKEAEINYNKLKDLSNLISSESSYLKLNAVNIYHESIRSSLYPHGWDERKNLGFQEYDKSPNLFLYGFAQNRGVFLDTVGRFREWGFELNYRLGKINTFKEVEKNILYVDKRVNQIIAQSNCKTKKINFIAHSYGGLLARDYSYRHPEKIENCVMLGTPNHGTKIAYFGYILTTLLKYSSFNPILYHGFDIDLDNASTKLMFPESQYLNELNKKIPPKNVKFVNIYTPNDEAIINSGSKKLPFAKNIDIEKDWNIKNRGHMALIHDYHIIDKLCCLLNELCNGNSTKQNNKSKLISKIVA